MSQLDLFAPRIAPLSAHVGVKRGHPTTSREAAKSVKASTVKASQDAVLALLKTGDYAQWEAVEELRDPMLSDSRIRSAFSELEKQGLAKRVGRKKTPFNRNCDIWRAV